MRKTTYVIFFILIISSFVYSFENINTDFKYYLGIIDSHIWKKTITADKSKGYETIEKINKLFAGIVSDPGILSSGKVKKYSDGFLKTGDITIYLDYSELYEDTLINLVYYDATEKILMVLKDGRSLFVIDSSGETTVNYIIRLNSLLFESDDFTGFENSIQPLKNAIDEYFFTSSIIAKNNVTSVYGRNDISWHKYVINPDDDRIIFKPDIEYDLKYEFPLYINFFGLRVGPRPANLYPVWLKYTRKFVSSPDSSGYFNELITIPNFYDVWRERTDNWIKNKKKIELNEKTDMLISSTQDVRDRYLDVFEKANRFNLTKKNIDLSKKTEPMDENIVLLNRLLLEQTFPSLCPRMCNLNFIPESIAGDIDDFIDEESVKMLLTKNMNTSFYLEKNENIKAILEEKSGRKDDDVIRMETMLKLKKIFQNTELMSFDISCGNHSFENEKYLNASEMSLGAIDRIDLSNINGKSVTKFFNYKKTIKLKHYLNALTNHFEKNTDGTVFRYMYNRIHSELSKMFDFFNGMIIIDNIYYDAGKINDMTYAIMKMHYEYMEKNEGGKININSNDWELPVFFIRIDEKTFTAYFLDYEKK